MTIRWTGPVAAVLALNSSAFALDAPAHPVEVDPPAVKRIWAQRLPGFVTDLAVSSDAGAVFFATIPDFDRDNGQRDFRVNRVGRTGKTLWSKKTDGQVKAVSMSDDGKVAVYADYNDELTALGPTGRQLWKVHGPCRPLVMAPLKKVVCYHDDDAEPRLAYEILDLKTGKRSGSFPITGDVLALKLSADARSLVMGLHDGTAPSGKQNRVVVVSGLKLEKIDEGYVGGPIVDVSLSNGTTPAAAVLWNSNARDQRVTVFHGAEMTPSDVAMSAGRAEQIEIAASGDHTFIYGNSAEGQWLRAFSGTPLRLDWSTLMSPKQAEFSSGITVTEKAVIAGVEVMSELTRSSYYRAFQLATGAQIWQAPMTREPGSFLYTQAWAPRRGWFVAGMDDAWLSAFSP